MDEYIERRLQEIRIESRRFNMQLILVMAALFVAGGGLTIASAAVFSLIVYHH